MTWVGVDRGACSTDLQLEAGGDTSSVLLTTVYAMYGAADKRVRSVSSSHRRQIMV